MQDPDMNFSCLLRKVTQQIINGLVITITEHMAFVAVTIVASRYQNPKTHLYENKTRCCIDDMSKEE